LVEEPEREPEERDVEGWEEPEALAVKGGEAGRDRV
jgi:hypothetical protein